ncbi:hypothetical protein [Parapedobacter sp.]
MEDELSYQIIGKAIELHRSIGPGLLESARRMSEPLRPLREIREKTFA